MTSVDAACDLNTRLNAVLSTSLLIKALFVSSTKVLHGLVSLLPAFVWVEVAVVQAQRRLSASPPLGLRVENERWGG